MSSPSDQSAATRPVRSQDMEPHLPPHSTESGRHPVNLTHLIMGVAFLGFAGLWAVVTGDVVGGEDLRWLLPVPWLAAGSAGLVAIAVSRMRRVRVARDDGDVGVVGDD